LRHDLVFPRTLAALHRENQGYPLRDFSITAHDLLR
jgi:hypothetical protein